MSIVQDSSRSVEILTTAARLFAVKGYDATSMSDVAAAVGVSKSLIYHYFSSKTEMLYLIHHRVLSDGLAMLEAAKQTDRADDRLRAIIRGHVRLVLDNVDANLVLSAARGQLSEDREAEIQRMRDKYARGLRSTYVEGVARGLMRDIDPDFAVSTILAACNWLYRWRPRRGRAMSADEAADGVLALIGSGVFVAES